MAADKSTHVSEIDESVMQQIYVTSNSNNNSCRMVQFNHLEQKFYFTNFIEISYELTTEEQMKAPKDEFLKKINYVKSLNETFKDDAQFRELLFTMVNCSSKNMEINYNLGRCRLRVLCDAAKESGDEAFFVELIKKIFKLGMTLIQTLFAKGYFHQRIALDKIWLEEIGEDTYVPRFIGYNKLDNQVKFSTELSSLEYYGSQILKKVTQLDGSETYLVQNPEEKLRLEIYALFRTLEQIAQFKGEQ